MEPTPVLIILMALVPASLWLLARSLRVVQVLTITNDLCAAHNHRQLANSPNPRSFNPLAIYAYTDKVMPGYGAMLFSVRPLTVQEWMPQALQYVLLA